MYSDTHCHLSHLVERGIDLASLFTDLSREGYRLAFDIGTKPGDFHDRLERVRDGVARARAPEDRPTGNADFGTGPASLADSAGVPAFVHFSCGLWPDGEVIANRAETVGRLAEDLKAMKALAAERKAANGGGVALAALGECGLDRYWNGAEAPGRLAALAAAEAGTAVASDDGPGTEDLAAEEELFAMQLDLAKAESLPVIVHSRDAFAPTEAIIRNSGLSRGVIHCWSYGIPEARAFLDLGYHISFPGNVTWPKKEADRERVAELLRFVPRDRLLLETDAPYLTPAPHRGKVNTPYLVRHVYERVAAALDMDVSALSLLVWENSVSLFGI